MKHFTHRKKKIALEELQLMLECGERAGIRKAMFLGFGVMLGQVMLYNFKRGCGDFIPNDNDMDMCIDADTISADQELCYYNELSKAGLFANRRKISLKKDPKGFYKGLIERGGGESGPKVRFNWLSLRHKHHGVKSCNWFFYKWNGFYWHSKGGQWVTARKFDPGKFAYKPDDVAMAKGIPARFIKPLVETDFHGVRVQFPLQAATCADYWYPGWWLPKTKRGASRKTAVCAIKDWGNKKTWRTTIVQ